ncbi:hypothetical protein N7462_005488 [Penicillium macrosclerotiorum]|uniref:uncharacterized protein n=1 Tax=Penicillium macrosclerotiorum TaxID=303699 RepID=UPI0025493725|nr:uncharacterized protein N7462_005488 [Penicillium macrosclerotiorum]KAJ5682323.1 hypothetical protein N7462_005488 [Penicillium macrosclerotiorum]
MCPPIPRYHQYLTPNSRSPGQEQLSKEEIKAGEVEACQTVQMVVVSGVLLYLCKSKLQSAPIEQLCPMNAASKMSILL